MEIVRSHSIGTCRYITGILLTMCRRGAERRPFKHENVKVCSKCDNLN